MDEGVVAFGVVTMTALPLSAVNVHVSALDGRPEAGLETGVANGGLFAPEW
jgi:hypothetical protein